tara:strand:- start:1717 stop:1959 length:243 start_codon:yes stop_codon:yes gene_type:complete
MNAFDLLLTNQKYSNMYKKIIEVGNHLKDKLPDSKRHPKGRNAHAHVFQMIKKKYGCSYKNVSNKRELWEYLDWIKKHPC